jgi:hypothetical protein
MKANKIPRYGEQSDEKPKQERILKVRRKPQKDCCFYNRHKQGQRCESDL